MFFLFGNKTINIVFYGAFFWLMLTAYKNKIRVNLLGETKNIVYESKSTTSNHSLGKQKNMYKGVDPKSVKGLTSSIGSIFQNYGSDPLEKLIVLGFCFLACSQFMI